MGEANNCAIFSEDGAMLAAREQMSNTINRQFHFFFPLIKYIRCGYGDHLIEMRGPFRQPAPG